MTIEKAKPKRLYAARWRRKLTRPPPVMFGKRSANMHVVPQMIIPGAIMLTCMKKLNCELLDPQPFLEIPAAVTVKP